jgi:desampylase
VRSPAVHDLPAQLTTTDPVLAVPRALLDQIVEHARARPLVEQCGLLLGWTAGSLTHATIHEACGNDASEPACRYAIGTHAYLHAERRGRRLGLDVIGVYHSHPEGEATPSQIDAELAWPNTAYLIVALRGRSLSVAAWHLDEQAPGRWLTPMRLRVR